jgi:hypothetical protein
VVVGDHMACRLRHATARHSTATTHEVGSGANKAGPHHIGGHRQHAITTVWCRT